MAAGRNLTASLLLRLRDLGVVAGLNRIRERMLALRNIASRLTGLPMIGGALAGALGAGAAIREAATFQTGLIDIANTLGLTGERARALRVEMTQLAEGLARRYMTSSQGVIQGANELIRQGIPEDAMKGLLDSVTRLSVAERVAVEDAAKLVGALHDVGRIPVDRVYLNLSRIMRAGQLGAVEIRDMAREFPSLLTLMDQLGVRGESAVNTLAASLQVARRGAGDATEAMNNMRNLLSKLRAEETVKNFADFGVDLPGVVRNAERQGINIFDALVQKVRQMAGNDPFKLAKLFADMQANAALAPIMRNVQDFLIIREQVALADEGALNQNLAARLEGYQAQLDLMGELTAQLGRRIGQAIAPGLAHINALMGGMVDGWDTLPARIERAGEAIQGFWREVRKGIDTDLKRLMGIPDRLRELFDGALERPRGGQRFRLRLEEEGAPSPELRRRREGERGRLPGFYGDDPAVRPQSAPIDRRSDLRGRIEIALAPGLVLRRAEADQSGVRFEAPMRGQMLPAV